MPNKDYSLILSTHFENYQWILNGDNYDGLIWLSDIPKPSKTQLDALWESTVETVRQKKAESIAARQAVLDRLGLTAEEAQLILGGSN